MDGSAERPMCCVCVHASPRSPPFPVKVMTTAGSLVARSRARTCDKNLAVMGLPARGPRQRWHCPGEIQEVSHPEATAHS